MDGSGFLKSGSGSAKKPGSIRIRIRNAEKMTDTVPPRWFYFTSVDCLLCYFTAHRGIRFFITVLYLYSINSAICRPADCTGFNQC